MKRFFVLIFVVTGFCVSGIMLCYTQDVSAEEWTGTLKRTDKRPENVTFEVNKSEENLFFIGMKYSGEKFEFKEQKIKGDILTFTWTPGDLDTNCHLTKQEDDSFAGKCRYTNSDKSLDLSLIPPVEELQTEEAKTEEPQTEVSQTGEE